MREIGQICFGQPTEEHDLPDFVRSMFRGIERQFGIVYWNWKQEEFDGHAGPVDIGAVHWRPYSWNDEDGGPNFWLDNIDVKLRWYKHPGRGMTTNRKLSAAAWAKWHDKVMAELDRFERERRGY